MCTALLTLLLSASELLAASKCRANSITQLITKSDNCIGCCCYVCCCCPEEIIIP